MRKPRPLDSLLSRIGRILERATTGPRRDSGRGGSIVRVRREWISRESGHASVFRLPTAAPPGDDEEEPNRSGLRLFEDGVELGPPHASHAEIRELGGGRFSHWGRHVWFSTSDNSPPTRGRRRYEVVLPASGPENAVLAGIGCIDLTRVPDRQRFELARQAFRAVWKDCQLPDIGRRIDADREFAAEIERLSPETDVTAERKFNLNELFQLAHPVAGDVAECGTFKGGSAYFLARQIARHRLDKRLCLFDSFRGVSAPAEVDGDWWRAGDLCAPRDQLDAALAPLGELDFIDVFEGWIPERFAEVAGRRFCFVHIDVDLYQPTLDSLAFFYPLTLTGGIILFDDYGFDTCPGVTSAVDHFMADKPEPIVNLAAGGAFVIKR